MVTANAARRVRRVLLLSIVRLGLPPTLVVASIRLFVRGNNTKLHHERSQKSSRSGASCLQKPVGGMSASSPVLQSGSNVFTCPETFPHRFSLVYGSVIMLHYHMRI
jgi:hypothetical protein